MLRFGQTTKFELRIDMQADEAVSLNVRGITREGQFTYKPTTAATAATITQETFGVPDIPIMVTVEDAGRNLEQGQAFVTVSLLANGEVIQQLVSGYLYAQKALSWPNTQQVDLRPGGGRLTGVTGTNPAAGVEISHTVPTGEMWKIQAVTFGFAASAIAGARRIHLVVIQPFTTTMHFFSSLDIAANGGGDFSCAPMGVIPDELDDGRYFIAIPPDLVVRSGGTISTETVNLDGGDNFTAPIFTIEKYFTTP